MADGKLNRRDFVYESALGAAGVAFGLTATKTIQAGNPSQEDTSHIPSYNPGMEYRRCGKTNMMMSAVCLGGHWKRVDVVLPQKSQGEGWLGWGTGDPDFDKNRYEVVSRCIDRGINYIDACWSNEVMAYSKALQGRRDKMYLGFSWGDNEVRFPEWRTCDRLKEGFQAGLKAAGLEYVDLWRITCLEESSQHDEATIEELIKALDWAKQSGLARFTGISSHDRPHIKKLIEKYPDQLEVICTPYTARTKVVTDESGLWAAMKQFDVGWLGIKPFASNSLFKGDSARQSASGRRQPVGTTGHPLYPLQSRHHRSHPGTDHGRAGRQHGLSRDGAPRAGCRREGSTGSRHGSRLGQPARPIPVAEGLGIRVVLCYR